MKNIAVLFAKAPRLGQVKRRLAADLGDRLAYRFHTQLLFRRLRQLSREKVFHRRLAVTPDTARLRLPISILRVGQGQGDLGMRMQRVFQSFPHDRVVLVGGDIPGMTMADLRAAFRLLGSADAVFGPALDGGYWMVGMAPRRPAHPFDKVRWSTQHALNDTIKNFGGKKIRLLRTLRDIDTGADYAAWRSSACCLRQSGNPIILDAPEAEASARPSCMA